MSDVESGIEIPAGPIEQDPPLLSISYHDRKRLLLEVFAGVELGAFDRHVIAWLAGLLEGRTFIALVSIIGRARETAPSARNSTL